VLLIAPPDPLPQPAATLPDFATKAELVSHLTTLGCSTAHDSAATDTHLLLDPLENTQYKVTKDDLALRDCSMLKALESTGVVPRVVDMAMYRGFSVCATERLPNVQTWESASSAARAAAAPNLIRAVAHLKRRGVEHRDLHAENVLLDENGMVFLVDFTWAMFTNNEDSAAWDVTRSFPDGLIVYSNWANLASPTDLHALGELLKGLETGELLEEMRPEAALVGARSHRPTAYYAGRLEALADELQLDRAQPSFPIVEHDLKCDPAHTHLAATHNVHVIALWSVARDLWDELLEHIETAVEQVRAPIALVRQRRPQGGFGGFPPDYHPLARFSRWRPPRTTPAPQSAADGRILCARFARTHPLALTLTRRRYSRSLR
jgi:hypothetical protein